ncbi:MAG: hypothetical protein ABEK36_03825, partial [Candidatus Aenigmatarchaeota archaeon]
MKKTIFCFLILVFLAPACKANSYGHVSPKNHKINISLKNTFPNTLYDHRILGRNNYFLDMTEKKEGNKNFYTIDEEGFIYKINSNFNSLVNSMNVMGGNVNGICKTEKYFYYYDQDVDKLYKYTTSGRYVKDFYLDKHWTEGMDCTKNHIWILGGERNNLR